MENESTDGLNYETTAIQFFLGDLLGCLVDLVTEKAPRPFIEKETVSV